MVRNIESESHGSGENREFDRVKSQKDPDKLEKLRRAHFFSKDGHSHMSGFPLNPLDIPKERSVGKLEGWRRQLRRLDKEPRSNRLGEVYRSSLDDYKWLKEKKNSGSQAIEQFVPAINQLVQRIETLKQRALPPKEDADHLGRKGRDLILVELNCIAEDFKTMRRQAEELLQSGDEQQMVSKVFEDRSFTDDPISDEHGDHSQQNKDNKNHDDTIIVYSENGEPSAKDLREDTLVDFQISSKDRAKRVFEKAQSKPFNLHFTDQQRRVYETDMRIDEHAAYLTQELRNLQESSTFDEDQFKTFLGLTPQNLLQNLGQYFRDKVNSRIGEAMNYKEEYTSKQAIKSENDIKSIEHSLAQYTKIIKDYEKYVESIGQNVMPLALENSRSEAKRSRNRYQRFFLSFKGEKMSNTQSDKDIPSDYPYYIKYMKERNELVDSLQKSSNFDQHVFQHYIGLRPDDLKNQNKIGLEDLKEQIRKLEIIRDYMDTIVPYMADLTQRVRCLQESSTFDPQSLKEGIGFDADEFLQYRPTIEPGIGTGSGFKKSEFQRPKEFWQTWYRGQVKNLENCLTYQEAPNILRQLLTSLRNSPEFKGTAFEHLTSRIMTEYQVNKHDKAWCYWEIEDLRPYQVSDQIKSLRERLEKLRTSQGFDTARFEESLEFTTPQALIESLDSFDSTAKLQIKTINTIDGDESTIARKLEKAQDSLKAIQDSVNEYRVLLDYHFPDKNKVSTTDSNQSLSSKLPEKLEWWEPLNEDTYKKILRGDWDWSEKE